DALFRRARLHEEGEGDLRVVAVRADVSRQRRARVVGMRRLARRAGGVGHPGAETQEHAIRLRGNSGGPGPALSIALDPGQGDLLPLRRARLPGAGEGNALEVEARVVDPV